MGIAPSKFCRCISPPRHEPRVSPAKLTDIQTDGLLSNEKVKTLHSTPVSNKFVVVWLDSDVINYDIVDQKNITRLQRIFISLHVFPNINDCTKYLSSVKNEKILIVISNEFFKEMWPRLKSMPQVHSVCILSPSGEQTVLSNQEYNKVRGVFTRIEPICSSLKRGTKHVEQDSLVMSIIPSMKYSKKDLQKLNQLFIYWMLVKRITLETKYDNDSIENLTKFCRTEYFSNNIELQIIDEFEQNYHQYSPIWWYTRDCFVRVMLNRALQTQDIEIIIRMGFFINDLYQQLEKLQAETRKTCRLPIIACRSQNVSNEDLEKMKSINGSLLTFNNFVTADPDYQASLNLARRAQNNNTGIGIIFRMKVESKQTSSPYASLQNVSYSPDKANHILFSMHSIFRIINMKQIENLLWEIDLTLTESSDEQIVSLAYVLRQETRDETSWLKLAHLMTIVRDFDHAKDIYYSMLELVADNDVLKMARIYNELGVLDDEMGDFASALSFYQKSIEIRQEHLPPNHRSLSVSYNNMGEVQRHLGDYFNALSTHKKALDIKQKSLRPNDISFATTYNNIGLANELLGEFSTALAFYLKALEIKRNALPADHQQLATTYNNIGELQRAMGNYPAALTNLEKALQIRLKECSPMDSSLAITYNNIGLVRSELGDYTKAISYLEKSLNVKSKSLPPNHPSIALSYNNIGDIHHQMGQYSQALSSNQVALDIQEKSLPPNHPDLATTYTNTGIAHQAMANYSNALTFYQKAVHIRQKALPPNHPLLGTSYNNMGHLHQLQGEHKIALEYYQKTLVLQQKSLQGNHPALAATYNNIADIERKLGNSSKALTLYKKSLAIKKISLPPHHPTLVITYNNMGVLYQSLKNYPAALECYKQTLEIQRKTLLPNHPDLATVYNNMGVTYQSMQECSNALDHYKMALEIQEQGLPSNHPSVANTHSSMATALVIIGSFDAALEHQQRAVDIASQSLAPDHPLLLTYQNYLERIRIKVESMKNT